MIQKTMTRQQLFELGNLDWATADELERAQEMKRIYDKLTTWKRKTFMEHFEDFLRTDVLMFSIMIDVLLDTENEIQLPSMTTTQKFDKKQYNID